MALIYALRDPRTDCIRYVGKANDLRARLASHLRDSRRRRTPVCDWIRSLMRKGLVPRIELLEQVEDSSWQSAEMRLIAQHREGNPDLLNLAPGGDQPYCSPAVRAENGRKVAASRNQRVWRLKLAMGHALLQGYVSGGTKQKLRLAAAKRPDLFGQWASL